MRLKSICLLTLLLFSTMRAYAQESSDKWIAPVGAKEEPTVGALKTPPTVAKADAPVTTAPQDALPYDPPADMNLDSSLASSCAARVFWVRADYLVWFIRKETPPAIISTIPDAVANNNPLPAGIGTTIYPTNGELNFKAFSGVRLNAGLWLNESHTIGIDATGFVTQANSNGAFYSSPGSPTLARTYVNANSGVLTYLEFSNPSPGSTGYSGTLSANTSISSIYSGDVNFRWNGYSISADNTDWIAGFRYFNFQEKLDIGGTINLRGGGPNIAISDHFSTTNNFYGGQIGFNSRWCGWHGFSADAIVKLAIGDMSQSLNISGSNTVTPVGGPSTTQATGLYAQPSNIGTFYKDKFSVIPEVTLNLNYSITQRAAIFVGYNFMYISNVVRAANTLDPTVNETNLRYLSGATPGNAPGPQPIFREQGLWLQGVNLGMKFDY